MMLWFLDDNGAMIHLERLEVSEVDHFEAGIGQRAFCRVEDCWRRSGDICRSRFHHQESDPSGSKEVKVSKEDPILIALGDVLVQDIGGADPSAVRFGLCGVAEDRYEIWPLFRYSEKVPERSRREFD